MITPEYIHWPQTATAVSDLGLEPVRHALELRLEPVFSLKAVERVQQPQRAESSLD